MRLLDPPPEQISAAFLSRLKILAGLDIAERRRPQDGRAEVLGSNGPLDLRVAAAASLHGETISLRLLRRSGPAPRLDELGAPPEITAGLTKLLARPSGLIVVAGPTGSGKTTTLYAALEQLNRPDRKITTIEDPVERRVPGATQTQVKPSLGVDFPAALRALLRHDPDVLMVGETRDPETARIAAQAALTGHLVLTSVHAADAAAASARLTDMGVEPALLGTTLSGVLAQRLFRRLCPHCRRQTDPAPGALRGVGSLGSPASDAPGCAECGGAGVLGRIAAFELLNVTEEISALISSGASTAQIRSAARSAGAVALKTRADDLAQAGEISQAEAARVAAGLA